MVCLVHSFSPEMEYCQLYRRVSRYGQQGTPAVRGSQHIVIRCQHGPLPQQLQRLSLVVFSHCCAFSSEEPQLGWHDDLLLRVCFPARLGQSHGDYVAIFLPLETIDTSWHGTMELTALDNVRG